jgi:hypothetical protein
VSKTRYVQSLKENSTAFAAAFAPTFIPAFAPAFPAILVSANASTAATFPAVPASPFASAG